MTPDQFLTEVAPLLPARQRAAALQDLRDLFATGVTPSDLGSPAAYAAMLTDDPDPSEPQASVLGVPLDMRGPVDSTVRSRLWDPTNPNILVPHVAGLGWSVNFGALAVRLGLLRPDDYDPAVVAAIPRRVRTAARVLPVAAAAVAALATAATPSHRRTPTTPRWLPAALAAGVAAWGARSTTPEDDLVRSALAAGITSGLATDALLGACGHRESPAAHAVRGVSVAALPFAMMLAQVKLGLARVWRGERA